MRLWNTRTHYPVTVGVVEGLEFDDVGMAHNPHDLKLTVLRWTIDQYCSPRTFPTKPPRTLNRLS